MSETIQSSKASQFWDKYAREYNDSKIDDEQEYENGLNVTRQFLDSTHNVLEIGCGTGTTAIKLAADVSRITATDLSPEMIAICNEKKEAVGLKNVSFKVGTMDSLQLPLEDFDVILAYNLLHLVKNPEETINQVKSLLKPGGIFISKTPCLHDNFRYVFMRIPMIIAEKFDRAPKVTFFRTNQVDRMIESAGFELSHVYTNTNAPTRRFIAAKKL